MESGPRVSWFLCTARSSWERRRDRRGRRGRLSGRCHNPMTMTTKVLRDGRPADNHWGDQDLPVSFGVFIGAPESTCHRPQVVGVKPPSSLSEPLVMLYAVGIRGSVEFCATLRIDRYLRIIALRVPTDASVLTMWRRAPPAYRPMEERKLVSRPRVLGCDFLLQDGQQDVGTWP